ncbi:unnamed protein product [Prunus brigantina]
MASLSLSPSPPLPIILNRNRTTAFSTSSISQNPSRISFLGNRKAASFLVKAAKLERRELLIATLGGFGGFYCGSKMSQATGDLGEPAAAYAAETSSDNKVVELTQFPITLDSVISVVVPRPKKSRTKKEKEEEEEVLAIQGIEFLADEAVKFDVHVNDDEDSLSRPDASEFAGSFVYLPHKRKTVTTSLRLGITDLLDDVGADGDESIKVTLVPKYVKRPVTIRHIKIEFLK